MHNSVLQALSRTTQFYRKEKIEESNISEKRLAGITQRDEGEGRLLPGDNTRSGKVVLRPIKFKCLRIWVLSGFLYVHTACT
jgi:hypothetical protein